MACLKLDGCFISLVFLKFISAHNWLVLVHIGSSQTVEKQKSQQNLSLA
jgi:hypothetical protein